MTNAVIVRGLEHTGSARHHRAARRSGPRSQGRAQSTRTMFRSLLLVGALNGAAAATQEATPTETPPVKPDAAGSESSGRGKLGRAEAMIVLDYQVVPVPQEPSLDLMGFHLLTKLTDWMYVGVGAYAPLVKGEYGGFTAWDVTAHAQRRLWGNVFANGGISLGGGGGGKDKEHSKVLTGTGGFVKGYVGLGYDFTDFTVGTNVTRMKFNQSAIDSTQLNVFVQVPFSYTIGPYASAGEKLAGTDAPEDSSENVLSWGLDNLVQIDPQGSNKAIIRLVDLQFAHYLTSSTYWYASLGIGYHGMPLYNQVIGGLGYRFRASPRVDLHAQLGLGSGGWAPDRIDTGSGLLVYPKATAEFAISENFGLAVTAGYLFAPTGSSKNYTFGAALHYHLHPERGRTSERETSDGTLFKGYRIGLFQQTALNVRDREIEGDRINMLTAQLDAIVSDHVYIPVQGAIGYESYRGYPAYGELAAGVGLQSKYDRDNPLQFFGQLLVGTNPHGPIVKPGIGMNYGLSDRLAIYATAGATVAVASNKTNFRSDNIGLGLTYRFSLPSW